MLEWNQAQTPTVVAFSCSHSPSNGCNFWIVAGSTLDVGLLLVTEVDHADQLHREHAWRILDRHATTGD